MLKPEYLQRVPDGMIKLYAQAEADILADMARRISTYDYWIPAVEHQAKMLEEAGMVREEILARLKTLTGRADRELRQLMQEAGTAALKSDDAVYCNSIRRLFRHLRTYRRYCRQDTRKQRVHFAI